MKPSTRIAGKPALAIAVALLAAAGLAACGGHSLYGGDDATPAPVVDAYVTAVTTTLATSQDDTEPGAIDSFVATAPDDTEPQPLS